MLPPFTIKSWVTCRELNQKTCLTDVLRISLERLIIWSPGRPTTGSRRCPIDVSVEKFWIFVLPVKSKNRYVIQGLLLLKDIFFIKLSVFVLVPENPLKVPFRSRMSETLGNFQGMSVGRRVPAGLRLEIYLSYLKILPFPDVTCYLQTKSITYVLLCCKCAYEKDTFRYLRVWLGMFKLPASTLTVSFQ